MLKKILLGLVGLIVLVAIGGGGFVMMQTSAFDKAAAKVWDIKPEDVKAPDLLAAAAYVKEKGDAPVPIPAASTDPAAPPVDPAEVAKAQELQKSVNVYRRGDHLAHSIGACLACHGPDGATPEVIEMGPVGKVVAANISMGGKLKEYSDGELHRLLVHGIKKDGTSVIFMPSGDFRWWPDSDLLAAIGYLRTLPAVDKPSGKSEIGTLGKVLDRQGKLPLLTAEKIAGTPRNIATAPAPTAEYGKSLAGLCMGCHGETLSGGPIPGAPPSLPIPKNITKHATGIAHYDFAKFDTLLRTGKKPDGSALDPFMPVNTLKNMSDVEMKALWAYLETVPPKEFGGR